MRFTEVSLLLPEYFGISTRKSFSTGTSLMEAVDLIVSDFGQPANKIPAYKTTAATILLFFYLNDRVYCLLNGIQLLSYYQQCEKLKFYLVIQYRDKAILIIGNNFIFFTVIRLAEYI